MRTQNCSKINKPLVKYNNTKLKLNTDKKINLAIIVYNICI